MICFLKGCTFFLFLIIVKGVHCYMHPICSRNAVGCDGDITEDINDNSYQNILSTVVVSFNCVICSALSFVKYLYKEFAPKANIFLSTGRTYKYKPPPSLFETLAIWTGAKKEDNSDDELWEAQKIFMLASAIIFAMLFLYYGQIWFTTCKDIPEFKNNKICHYCQKYLHSSKISPSVSFATCTCEAEENWNVNNEKKM
ncbi:hypothetical protein HHI36_009616 [Cryptolaemus montrouzieri]|uniref:Uncharacterized protein n=1 Tax=Cryptolaemus montrouzieri TaxID=559131 RepID=A0ABD2MGE2_9CUCU